MENVVLHIVILKWGDTLVILSAPKREPLSEAFLLLFSMIFDDLTKSESSSSDDFDENASDYLNQEEHLIASSTSTSDESSV
ncbi:hypothetical protein T11_13431 [Trichinella zimbabwensis]|uniref:PiggyBac transposable element-derived protein domain-containing protein n=1 Tax=Trichinella zimbabwensis TaxID=268475 RepID=A0A0V1HTJ1_9BILA|nr:hypothetical protein T11_13431 [Trichinella zimbabwensis]